MSVKPLKLVESASLRPLKLVKLDVEITCEAFLSQTQVTMVWNNPTENKIEAELSFPLPEGGYICGYSVDINGRLVPGVIVKKEKARATFEAEVRKDRGGPAIIEQSVGNIFNTRVYPFLPKSSRTIQVIFTQDLISINKADSNVDNHNLVYSLPFLAPSYPVNTRLKISVPSQFSPSFSSISQQFTGDINNTTTTINSLYPTWKRLKNDNLAKMQYLWEGISNGDDTSPLSTPLVLELTSTKIDASIILENCGPDIVSLAVSITDIPSIQNTELTTISNAFSSQRIGLLWDCSKSRGENNSDRSLEINCIESILDHFNSNGQKYDIDLIPFNVKPSKEVMSFDANQSSLISQRLRSDEIVYQGGTNYSNLESIITDNKNGFCDFFEDASGNSSAYKLWIVVTDGISTFGSKEIPNLLAPVYLLSASTQGDPSFLRKWARKSNGKYFNLRSMLINDVIQNLTDSSTSFLYATLDNIKLVNASDTKSSNLETDQQSLLPNQQSSLDADISVVPSSPQIIQNSKLRFYARLNLSSPSFQSIEEKDTVELKIHFGLQSTSKITFTKIFKVNVSNIRSLALKPNSSLSERSWAHARLSEVQNILEVLGKSEDDSTKKEKDFYEQEQLCLSQKFSLVTPNTSLIVLETLEQYLDNMICPPTALPEIYKQYNERIAVRMAEEEAKLFEKSTRVHQWWQRRTKWSDQMENVRQVLESANQNNKHRFGLQFENPVVDDYEIEFRTYGTNILDYKANMHVFHLFEFGMEELNDMPITRRDTFNQAWHFAPPEQKKWPGLSYQRKPIESNLPRSVFAVEQPTKSNRLKDSWSSFDTFDKSRINNFIHCLAADYNQSDSNQSENKKSELNRSIDKSAVSNANLNDEFSTLFDSSILPMTTTSSTSNSLPIYGEQIYDSFTPNPVENMIDHDWNIPNLESFSLVGMEPYEPSITGKAFADTNLYDFDQDEREICEDQMSAEDSWSAMPSDQPFQESLAIESFDSFDIGKSEEAKPIKKREDARKKKKSVRKEESSSSSLPLLPPPQASPSPPSSSSSSSSTSFFSSLPRGLIGKKRSSAEPSKPEAPQKNSSMKDVAQKAPKSKKSKAEAQSKSQPISGGFSKNTSGLSLGGKSIDFRGMIPLESAENVPVKRVERDVLEDKKVGKRNFAAPSQVPPAPSQAPSFPQAKSEAPQAQSSRFFAPVDQAPSPAPSFPQAPSPAPSQLPQAQSAPPLPQSTPFDLSSTERYRSISNIHKKPKPSSYIDQDQEEAVAATTTAVNQDLSNLQFEMQDFSRLANELSKEIQTQNQCLDSIETSIDNVSWRRDYDEKPSLGSKLVSGFMSGFGLASKSEPSEPPASYQSIPTIGFNRSPDVLLEEEAIESRAPRRSTRLMAGSSAPKSAQISSTLASETSKIANESSVRSRRNQSAQIEQVREIVTQNIDKVLERGESIERLSDKSDNLITESYKFRKTATLLKRRMWLDKLTKLLFVLGYASVATSIVWLISWLLTISFWKLTFHIFFTFVTILSSVLVAETEAWKKFFSFVPSSSRDLITAQTICLAMPICTAVFFQYYEYWISYIPLFIFAVAHIVPIFARGESPRDKKLCVFLFLLLDTLTAVSYGLGVLNGYKFLSASILPFLLLTLFYYIIEMRYKPKLSEPVHILIFGSSTIVFCYLVGSSLLSLWSNYISEPFHNLIGSILPSSLPSILSSPSFNLMPNIWSAFDLIQNAPFKIFSLFISINTSIFMFLTYPLRKWIIYPIITHISTIMSVAPFAAGAAVAAFLASIKPTTGSVVQEQIKPPDLFITKATNNKSTIMKERKLHSLIPETLISNKLVQQDVNDMDLSALPPPNTPMTNQYDLIQFERPRFSMISAAPDGLDRTFMDYKIKFLDQNLQQSFNPDKRYKTLLLECKWISIDDMTPRASELFQIASDLLEKNHQKNHEKNHQMKNDENEINVALQALSTLTEMHLDKPQLVRACAYKLEESGYLEEAAHLYRRVLDMRGEEPQSYRDLALVLAQLKQWKECLDLFDKILTRYKPDWDPRFSQIEVVSMMDLCGIIPQMNQLEVCSGLQIPHSIVPVVSKPLQVDLRAVLTWDVDGLDLELQVRDPNGEKLTSFSNQTKQGGLLSRDFAGGYGPVEFLAKQAFPGNYNFRAKIRSPGSKPILGGEVTIRLHIFTDFGVTDKQKMRMKVWRIPSPARGQTVNLATVSVNWSK